MSAFGIDIPANCVRVFQQGDSKRTALDALVEAILSTGAVSDSESFRRAVHEREDVMSTGIGQGIAIPHVRLDVIERPVVGIGIAKDGIDFDTLDNEPVSLIVLFAMPAGAQKEYLGLLAQVMRALKDDSFRNTLLECDAPAEISRMINDEKIS